jgi:hypothetical protein
MFSLINISNISHCEDYSSGGWQAGENFLLFSLIFVLVSPRLLLPEGDKQGRTFLLD